MVMPHHFLLLQKKTIHSSFLNLRENFLAIKKKNYVVTFVPEVEVPGILFVYFVRFRRRWHLLHILLSDLQIL